MKSRTAALPRLPLSLARRACSRRRSAINRKSCSPWRRRWRPTPTWPRFCVNWREHGWPRAVGLPQFRLDRAGPSFGEAPVPSTSRRRHRARPADTPTELPAAESPTAFVWHSQEPLWVDVESADTRFPVLRAAYARQGVRTACFVPLTTPRSKLGAIGFTSYSPSHSRPAMWSSRRPGGPAGRLAVEGALTR